MKSAPLWLYILIGAAGGLLAGLAGVGGGIVLVPLMTAWLGLSQKESQATSLTVIIPTALVSALLYAFYPRVEPPGNEVPAYIPAMGYALSSVLTAPLAARLTRRLDAQQLRRLFAILITAVAVRLLWQDERVGNMVLIVGLVLMAVVAAWDLTVGRRKTA
jgi:uncharacterized membrane protein YfcA